MTHDDQVPREIDPGTGLPIGPRLLDCAPAKPPVRSVLEGRYTRLEPLDPVRHLSTLQAASMPPDAAARFRYLPEPPPASPEAFERWITAAAASRDPRYFAVIDRASGHAEGRQALMRITPEHRSIEIGHIYWGARIAGTRIAT